jgi:hypothetical protein
MRISKQKIMNILYWAAAISIAVLAIIVMIFSFGDKVGGFSAVIMFICSFLLLALSGMIIYFGYLSRDVEPNFFLYDKEKKKNIDIEELDFNRVYDKMNLYFAMNVDSLASLWQGNFLERKNFFGEEEVYRTVVVYKMIFDLTEKDEADAYDMFGRCPRAVIAQICNTLTHSQDSQLAQKLLQIRNSYNGDYTFMRDFLIGNRRYIQKKVLTFVKTNIDKFYK